MVWTVVIFILLGILLLVVELVILPGVNLAGIAGILLLAGGIFVAYRVLGTTAGHITLGLSMMLLAMTLTLSLRAGTWKKISLSTEISSRVNESESVLHEGDCGVALTRLAPMGMADFGGHEFEVRTDGLLIDAGTTIRIIRMHDGRAVVQPVTASSSSESE